MQDVLQRRLGLLTSAPLIRKGLDPMLLGIRRPDSMTRTSSGTRRTACDGSVRSQVAMASERSQIEQNCGDDDNIVAGFRTTIDLDLFRLEAGRVLKPDIFDDGPMAKQDPRLASNCWTRPPTMPPWGLAVVARSVRRTSRVLFARTRTSHQLSRKVVRNPCFMRRLSR